MCTTFVAKLIVGIVNTLVFILGLAMFIIGLLIHTQPQFSQKALSGLLDQLEDTASKADVTIDTSDFSVAEIAYSATIAFIFFGLFLASVSVLGLIGVKYSLKPLLIVYFIIILVLFLAQVVIVLICYIDRKLFDDTVKPRLKSTIEDYYEGMESNDATTQVWNAVMSKMECCGVDNYEDFNAASKWSKLDPGLITPIPCCKTITNVYTCATSDPPLEADNNFNKGCYDEIMNFIVSDSGIVAGISAVVLCAQLVLLVLTFLILRSMGKVDVV